MQVVNIRRLKNSPATALRGAKKANKLGLPDPDAVGIALAVSLFWNGAVSAGFAARTVSKPLLEMLALLSSLGVSLASGAADGHDDMDTAWQWLDQTSSFPTLDH
ncbi:MAG: hypothetical protein V9G98_04290 [Candidatus Competibacter sp.]